MVQDLNGPPLGRLFRRGGTPTSRMWMGDGAGVREDLATVDQRDGATHTHNVVARHIAQRYICEKFSNHEFDEVLGYSVAG